MFGWKSDYGMGERYLHWQIDSLGARLLYQTAILLPPPPSCLTPPCPFTPKTFILSNITRWLLFLVIISLFSSHFSQSLSLSIVSPLFVYSVLGVWWFVCCNVSDPHWDARLVHPKGTSHNGKPCMSECFGGVSEYCVIPP